MFQNGRILSFHLIKQRYLVGLYIFVEIWIQKQLIYKFCRAYIKGKYKKVDDKYIKTFLSLQKQVSFFEVMLNTFNQRTSMGSTDALSIIYRDIIITLFRDMLWNEESELLQYTMDTFAEVENFNYTLEKIVEKYNWGENF